MISLNGDPITVTLFPDNTSQVWKLDEKHLGQKRATIWWEYTHEGELMQIAQLKHLLDFSGVQNVELQIKYLPYGRQDKWIANDATFALHSFAALLNTLHFEKVFILDPHSPVATQLINNSSATYPHGPLLNAIKATKADILCYPDKGAVEKYSQMYPKYGYIYGEKIRDQATGYISHYTLIGRPEGQRVLIVDDICDGGATFTLLAKDLIAAGAQTVNLFVTHGLFTKGLWPLYAAGIDGIYTAKGEVFRMPDGGHGFRSFNE